MSYYLHFIPGPIRRAVKRAVIARLPPPAPFPEQAELEGLRAHVGQLTTVLDNNGVPLPPPEHLQRRVVGGYVPGFIMSADIAIADFQRILANAGSSIEEHTAILDFGVGVGRVLRRVSERFGQGREIVGADIDAEAIAWLTENYGQIGTFVVVPHMPPSSLPSSHFDLVYSVSVFTHLDEQMQDAWLEELRRISRPGAHLLLTVHGDNYLRNFGEIVRNRAARDGMYYNPDAQLTDGLPEFYRTAYHRRDYIESHWTKFFELLEYEPMGNENHQDLILFRRRPE